MNMSKAKACAIARRRTKDYGTIHYVIWTPERDDRGRCRGFEIWNASTTWREIHDLKELGGKLIDTFRPEVIEPHMAYGCGCPSCRFERELSVEGS